MIVQDPTLLHSIDVFGGLKSEGYILINSGRTPAQLGITAITSKLPPGHVQCLSATDIALEHLGRPIPNAALIGLRGPHRSAGYRVAGSGHRRST